MPSPGKRTPSGYPTVNGHTPIYQISHFEPVCINYFSGYHNKTPDESTVRNGEFIFAHCWSRSPK